ncbi:MAG: hypothetical protein A2782_04355 [Candidatus Blackburnbacteria bacterium RIFCSPHIGHO2_01_FULL_43_15b]|uniref:OmpR/PhoB-type domain-containing protein n=1 Tax=Candidatus Blackburnbacteria bacterium RIFCSPHIGHO2_01_FULL_43_15b TaxID=1797513 RepID=A0A1G1V268_9BACT|nr:MAG: hypothetical protein A2782_04355 [Candidatus Blackburnbacteria bacterium RIFCSPHIGHO2_01_FULL_43_15b]
MEAPPAVSDRPVLYKPTDTELARESVEEAGIRYFAALASLARTPEELRTLVRLHAQKAAKAGGPFLGEVLTGFSEKLSSTSQPVLKEPEGTPTLEKRTVQTPMGELTLYPKRKEAASPLLPKEEGAVRLPDVVFEILETLAKDPRVVVNYEDLIKNVWKYESYNKRTDLKMVRTRVYVLRQLLGDSGEGVASARKFKFIHTFEEGISLTDHLAVDQIIRLTPQERKDLHIASATIPGRNRQPKQVFLDVARGIAIVPDSATNPYKYLSTLEADVLEALMRHPHSILPKDMFINIVEKHGYTSKTDDKTFALRALMYRLRQKLEEDLPIYSINNGHTLTERMHQTPTSF